MTKRFEDLRLTQGSDLVDTKTPAGPEIALQCPPTEEYNICITKLFQPYIDV